MRYWLSKLPRRQWGGMSMCLGSRSGGFGLLSSLWCLWLRHLFWAPGWEEEGNEEHAELTLELDPRERREMFPHPQSNAIIQTTTYWVREIYSWMSWWTSGCSSPAFTIQLLIMFVRMRMCVRPEIVSPDLSTWTCSWLWYEYCRVYDELYDRRPRAR